MEIGLVIPDLEEVYQRGEFYPRIEILKKAKVQKIEIHASFLENKREQKLLQLKEDIEERDISVSSVHAPFGEEEDLSSCNLRIRRRAINHHYAAMKVMNIMGISTLTIHPGSRVKEEKDIPLREELLRESLEKLLKTAESLKIKIAIENMLPMHPGDKAEAIKEIIDEFSSPFLGVCFDTGHANVGKGVNPHHQCIGVGVNGEFQIVKERVFDFHIHDNDGAWDMHLQPPYGSINWTEFFTAVEKIGYKRPLLVESFPWQGRELSWMMREVRMLKDNKILRKESPKDHFLRCAKCNHFIYGTESNPICYCNPPTIYDRWV